jgi:hypothetical protein
MSETDIFSALEKETKIDYIPGGCSYNAMRIFNVEINFKFSGCFLIKMMDIAL